MEKKRPLIVLTGPTAVGKTALSLALAKAVNGEIISADSMQVYRGMDIGTAKIKTEERQGIPHFLIDILNPDEEFHVVRFQELAREAMEDIYSRGKIPILVGGTGFYIQAVYNDIDFTEAQSEPEYRRSLEAVAMEQGAAKLHDMLRESDPLAAEQIHPNNLKRIIRALEFYHQTGQRISEHNEEQRQHSTPYDLTCFVLSLPREILYERINKRVDLMMEEGLLKEVSALKEKGYSRQLAAMQGLGYKELYAYLDGELTLEEAVEIIKRDTRHFAKRQLTWFKREKQVVWIQKEQFGEQENAILEYMLEYLAASKKESEEEHE